jgi:hypothetical protein
MNRSIPGEKTALGIIARLRTLGECGILPHEARCPRVQTAAELRRICETVGFLGAGGRRVWRNRGYRARLGSSCAATLPEAGP